MRILITPQPRSCYGPGIFLSRLAKELERRGYHWTSRPFHYLGLSVPGWDYVFMSNCPRRIEKVFQSNKPVVVTMGKPELKQELQAAGGQYLPKHDIQKQAMANAIRRSTKVVFISHYVCDIWREYFESKKLDFPNEDTIKVIYHGLDTNLFCPVESPPMDALKGPFVLGMAGSIRDMYRLKTLFNTSALLQFDHRLLIVGSMSKDCKTVFTRAMQDNKLASKTTYLPWIHHKKLVHCYRQMHCLFHPVDYEGFSIVISEALACGVPVVVPAHGAPKEYLLPDGGITVKTKQYHYDDVFCHQMADGVTRIRDNYSYFAHGARQRAVQNLCIEKTTDSYLDFTGLPRYLR
jgi:glycosyltransferase involved in cell wall biosynthesis